MPRTNGATADEKQGDNLAQRLREEQRNAGSGYMIPGDDPYADDWQMDLKLSECPDTIPASYELDAAFVVGKRDKKGRLRQSGLAKQRLRVTSFTDLKDLRESIGADRHMDDRFRRMREGQNYYPDPFGFGSEQSVPGAGAGVLGQYIPLWPGPVTRQMYWQDYFAMSAKAFEAYNHDPVSWRCVHMKGEFALGKGLQAKATYSSGSNQGQRHEKAQAVWEEFWDRNNMDARLDMFARDLSWGGEQFLRYFQKGPLLTVRSLDPASIYDLITDPEDHETVFAYHQQFQAAYQLYAPRSSTPPTGVQAPEGPTQPGASTKFIIRQILPQEIDHYRINVSAYERRGRSDLYPALGWIKRLRDYLTSHVIEADLLARICWDLTVRGNQAAVTATRANLFPNGAAPPPGSIFAHNEASTLTAFSPTTHAGVSGRWDPVLDALVTMVANSIGLPKDWLGFSAGNTRAGALVATEPAARSLEELQGTCEGVLHQQFDRVMKAAGISDAEVEFTFPSIASEDRSQKLQDLSYAEANGWLSKATAAAIAAKELGITNYDFDQEMDLIAEEFPEPEMEDIPDADPHPITGKIPQRPKQGDGTIRRSVIIATNRQAAKLDITKSPAQEDEPAGLLVPTDGSMAATPGGAPGGPPGASPNGSDPSAGPPPTRMGMPANENPMSGAGAANIRAQNTGGAGTSAEAAPAFTWEQVQWLMRETRRRTPDDPAFLAASAEYREESAKNLAQLVKDSVGE